MSDVALIALVLRDKRVEWTALQRRKHRMEIVQQKSVELDWPEAITDRRSPEAAGFLRSKIPQLARGRIGIAVPADRVLMRVVELPSIDSEELLGMAELQLDKISPFPSDQMALAVEVLKQTQDSSRVLIAAIQHDYIDQLGNFLTNAGLYPQSVDVDVLGWWALIRDSGKLKGEGQEILVIHDDHCAQLLVTHDGTPVIIRSLDTDLDPRNASYAANVAEEIEYTLMTLEGTWGVHPTSGIHFWTRGSASPELLEQLAGACGFEVLSANLEELPPLSEGLSRRMSATNGAKLDLAPAAWRSGIQSRKYQRQALLIGSVTFGVWAAAMLGLWLLSGHQKTMLVRTQADISRLQAEVESVRELRRQVESLQQYADRSYSGLECLREICTLLPASVDITSITYNKASEVNMRGEANGDAPINDFIAALEKSELFTKITTESISTQVRDGRNRSVFRVTMSLPVIVQEPES